jgi:hydroxymethylpyrimidine pyrophosphatase-like HAD family hydrolase
VTAHLIDGYYQVVEQHTVDAEGAIRAAVREAPGIRIAAEIVGVGYRVNIRFPDHEVNGTQRTASDLAEFWRNPTPRLALHGPEAYRLVPALVARDLTAIATRRDWVDVTRPGISKATALEQVRVTLGVEEHNTVAIGDSENDVEMLSWAAHGWAMGHAPAFVIAAADRVTATIDDDGAAAALHALLG